MSRLHSYRLPAVGRIDRDRPLSFTFNGRVLSGLEGDTIASALLANGVAAVSRSFKYHRARGILSAGVEEPNALLRVELDGTVRTLVRAPLEPLRAGMRITSENCFPSVDFDLGRALDFMHRLWPVGFYHKTFKWPSWRAYEPFVRRAAGLGTLPSAEPGGKGYRHSLHCDVLVVGGGLAGLSAALAASRAGADVVLMEQDCELGGRLLHEREQVEGSDARAWIDAVCAELISRVSVRVMCRTLVAGYYDHNVLTALDRRDAGRAERFWHVHAREVVLATGAIEQPLVFGHNDRPGIVLASAARAYLHRYGVAVGHNVVVATHHDEAYRTAVDLHDCGVRVVAIVDSREQAGTCVAAAAHQRGLRVHRSSVLADTRGSPAVTRAAIAPVSTAERSGSWQWLDCDAIAMSSAWNPTVHLYCQAGGKVRYESRLACLVPQACRQRARIVGAANAEFGIEDVLASAARAGSEAAQDSKREPAGSRLPRAEYRNQTLGLRAPPPILERGARQWIDFQHDVTTGDIALAVRESYVSIEHVKRYTTCGMSVDQGKTSNLNALQLVAQLTSQPVEAVGTTTFRPQFLPISLAAVSGGAQGALYAPERHSPLHEWNVRHGAQLEDYGGWHRPSCYRQEGETREQAILREVRHVRERLALFDGSPLGKIEVRGPDAAEFLHRIYMNDVRSLAPGRVRYGLMLNENAIVIDDGVFARLAPDHFIISTTAANGDRIAAWLDEWHQCEWPHLQVVIQPVSSQWAVLTLAGTRGRDLLSRLATDMDFSPTAFPHMSLRIGHLAGHAVRVQRVSFTGELGYEVFVPASSAEELCGTLMEHGQRFELRAVGVEAWLVLRLEKGFVHVGSDTDGTTTALDLGFKTIVEKKQGDFVGRRSLMRPRDRSGERRQLIGLETTRPEDALASGAHVVTGSGTRRRSEGFVTSAARSPTLQRSIGLALLERGHSRVGEFVTTFDQGQLVQARVVRPPWVDPSGARMNG